MEETHTPKEEPDEDIMLPLDEQQPKESPKEEPEEILLPAEEEKPPEVPEGPKDVQEFTTQIYAVRTTANREEQVLDFVSSNASKKGMEIFSVIHPHGMRGYIFVEATSRAEAEQATFRVPYARGALPSAIQYSEIEHMLEKTKKVALNIRKNDIAEIISGPFKREKCKITRIDKAKEEVVVELLEAAVPIPITLKIDAIKVIRREDEKK